MSTFTYGPALQSELAYRRTALLRDAANHRLARQASAARAAARTATRAIVSTVTAPVVVAHPGARPAAVPAPAETSAGPATPARQPVGCAA